MGPPVVYMSGASFTPQSATDVIGVACDRTPGHTTDVYVVNKDLTVGRVAT